MRLILFSDTSASGLLQTAPPAPGKAQTPSGSRKWSRITSCAPQGCLRSWILSLAAPPPASRPTAVRRQGHTSSRLSDCSLVKELPIAPAPADGRQTLKQPLDRSLDPSQTRHVTSIPGRVKDLDTGIP